MAYTYEIRENIKHAVRDTSRRYGCDQFSAREILDNAERAAGRQPIDWSAVYDKTEIARE